MGQADAAVEWLKERNIPLFSPLSILQTREEWEKDPMGMFGGFMSQSVVCRSWMERSTLCGE